MPRAFSPVRSFQWDLARQVEQLDWLLAQLPRYAAWGYQELHLHLEDAVEFPRLPGVARPDAFTYKQFGRLVDAATRAGIKVVPIINLLGHTQYLIKVPELRDLNELRAPDGSPLEHGQLCPVHPRTLEIAEKLLRDMAPFCTAGKVHTGLDESFHLGRHPASRKEIAAIGLGAHFAGYVNRLHGLTRSLGLRMGMWADMLCLVPEAIPLLPRDLVAYDWFYYPFRRRPRVELYNFADYDLATPLRARGIEYWGCPMNGAFRHEPLPAFGDRLANLRSWWNRGRRTGAAGFLVTSWEPSRLAMALTTVVDAAAACLWLDPEIDDPAAMLARGLERTFGRPVRPAARILLAADRFPFSGYARWRIETRWDTCVSSGPLHPWRSEARILARLAARAAPGRPGPNFPSPTGSRSGIGRRSHAATAGRTGGNLPGGAAPPGDAAFPEPVRASLAFRRTLAERDLFVRQAAQAVLALRRRYSARKLTRLLVDVERFGSALQIGRQAAQAMWTRSRKDGNSSPNVAILQRDAARLRAWRRWLERCRRDPAQVFAASPVCGKWQLLFRVRNFAPALQAVAVEQRQPGGAWATLHRLYLIEFKAGASHPRARIVRELSCPVDWAGPPAKRPDLRIAVRGFGQIDVREILFTDGVRHLRCPGRDRWQRLGQPAPTRGFPVFDPDRNRGAIELAFEELTDPGNADS
jgi:hypothetical protein